MSFYLDMPQYPTGSNDPAVAEIYRYLYQTASQLNYALSFLNLPEASPSAGGKQDGSDRVAAIGKNSTHAQTASARAVYDYAVPQTRKINLYELKEDLFLTAEDVDAVPITRKINDRPLTDDVHLVPLDLNIADYVISTGTSGRWTWQKWASGKTEAWGSAVEVVAGNWYAYTTELMTSSASIALPVEMADADYTILANVVGSGASAGVLSATRVSGTSASVVLICDGANTGSNYELDVYVCGVDRRG